jgi:hypothetical protein
VSADKNPLHEQGIHPVVITNDQCVAVAVVTGLYFSHHIEFVRVGGFKSEAQQRLQWMEVEC